MSLLSTLRPPSPRPWSLLLYLFSLFLVPPVSVPLTLGTLHDDCLLLLFSHLSLPQLFTLRGVSRRFAYLIERYTLPKWRTLIYGYSEKEAENRCSMVGNWKSQEVDLFFSRSVHPYTDFCRGIDIFYGPRHAPFYRQPRQMHPTVLCTLPATLPRLLPNLASLTFTCHYDTNFDSIFKMTEKCLAVNALLSGYLQSSWTTTLVSLHLYLEVGGFLHPPKAPFPLEALSQLVALRHLFLQLCPWPGYGSNPFPLLPDRLPVLGQLASFALHFYSGSNAPLLLAQLGPHLECLSLNEVICSVADFGAFLRPKPTYRQTLRTLEISLRRDDGEIPVVCQFLSSLERLCFSQFNRDNLRERLFNLSRLPSLRELSTLRMTVQQLRALRDNYPREGLPQLPSIRTLDCQIDNWQHPVVAGFTPEELFNTLLPPLSRIFCRLEQLIIYCSFPQSTLGHFSAPLTEKLTTKCKASFLHLRTCQASYYA